MKKLTRGQSCMLCQQRKVRCDQQKPCANCLRAQVECTVMPLAPPKPRKRKQSQSLDGALMDRLHRCEALLAQHGVDVDRELAAPSPRPSREPASVSAATDGAGTPKVNWFAYYKEYQATDELLRGSSDCEADQPAIHHDFDAMFDDSDGFPFVVGGGIENIGSLHPPVIEILQLWQVYIQRVDPLLKITHLPTLQAQIVSVGVRPTAIPKPLEALMFAIYLIAVHSMADNEVHNMFQETKPRLLARYHHATQQALINAAFMRATELSVLQAYLLYLFSISRSVDPRTLFCLVGIATRIGTRLGLHRDCARFGMSPFETELRRRLWWQIVIFDKRLAEMTGSPITALTSSPNDCCLPLNVNDPNLHPSARDPPIPAAGASEMLFSLTRIELAVAATTTTIDGRESGRFRPSPSAAVTHQSSVSPFPQSSEGDESRNRDRSAHRSPEDLEAYCAHFDAVYLQHCDPTIPIQHFTLLMARGALCKQRIFSFMCRRVPSSTLSLQERDSLFLAAIQMVEYDTLIYATDSLRGFRWYADLHVPMLGSIFLANELRLRPRGDLCDRAWKAIFENQEQRGGGNSNGGGPPAGKGRDSPMRAAFEHMLLKAWEACQQADLQSGRCTSQRQPPPLIARILGSRENPASEAVLEPRREDGQAENSANNSNDPLTIGPDTMLAAQLTTTSPPAMFDGLDQAYATSLYGYNQLDWTYLVQSGALQGFMDGPNGMYMG
ncbi:fungal-specific transcription factor domain-containing protein [Aspergillus terricola var. indicus]